MINVSRKKAVLLRIISTGINSSAVKTAVLMSNLAINIMKYTQRKDTVFLFK